MATFYVSRKIQHIILVEGCSGHDTRSRELRLEVAKLLQNHIKDEQFQPSALFNYDLARCLEMLNDETHAEIFKAYLNMV